MHDALLLLPDLLLIVAGFLVCRYTALNRPVWDGAERLVYYLLFPVLLFNSIVRSPLQLGTLLPLAGAGLAVAGLGISAAYALRFWPGLDERLHASGAQVAFRFNSYVALALAQRLSGAEGVAWMALIIAVCVPVLNTAAVWTLARSGGHGFGRELLRNPLILATGSGLLCNLLGLKLPAVVDTTFARIGGAALPLGLMAVGAGLQIGALRDGPRLAAALLGIKHLLMPLGALLITAALPLNPAQRTLVVAFSALPTASSCYVLAVRMGGHGAYVAGLVTLSTLLALAGLPLSLMLLRAVA